jgi:CHAD domain-containing protein
MAFRLDSDESLKDGVRRVARKQLRAAAEALHTDGVPHDKLVHDARKRIKKVRAIVRMLEEDGSSNVKNARRQLRRISRALSPVRDAAAILESLAQLDRSDKGLFNAATRAALEHRLSAHAGSLRGAAERDGTWKKARKRLRALARDARKWRVRHRGLKPLVAGVDAAHRQARKALARAQRRGRARDAHALRKALKTLWYQLRLIDTPGSPVHADVVALHEAEALLGDDHDLTVLRHTLTARGVGDGVAIDVDRLTVAIEAAQQGLRERAFSGIGAMLECSSSEYVSRIERAWRAAARPAGRRDTVAQPPRSEAIAG